MYVLEQITRKKGCCGSLYFNLQNYVVEMRVTVVQFHLMWVCSQVYEKKPGIRACPCLPF